MEQETTDENLNFSYWSIRFPSAQNYEQIFKICNRVFATFGTSQRENKDQI